MIARAVNSSRWVVGEVEARREDPALLLDAAMIGDSRRCTRQDNIVETWRIMAPLIDNPPRIHPYKPGSWGPKAADRLVADYGGWHGPWIAS